MKPPAEDWENQDTDKLLFDYLEGNLPGEQARALEQKAASEAWLGSEMEYWKDTVVTSKWYDTSRLEEKLLQVESIPASNAVKVSTGTSASLYLFLWLVCLCSIWPVKLEKERPHEQSIADFQIPVQERANQVIPVAEGISVEKAAVNHPETRKPVFIVATTSSFASVDRIYLPAISRLEKGQLQFPVSQEVQEVRLPASASKKLSVKQLHASRTITRKQARQIARMKDRALQRRMANEFLKGRVPYVVPLNTRNF